MPHIYFHLRRRDGILEDPEGANFDSMAAARTEARLAARGLVADMLESEGPAQIFALRLTSASGQFLEEVLLTSVVPEGLMNANDA